MPSLLIEFWCGISKSELVQELWIRHVPQRRHTSIADTFVVGVVVGRAGTRFLGLAEAR